MLFDLLWNIVGPLAAKRYALVRKLLWVLLAVYLTWITYLTL
jgi:hypothetical protein